MIALHDVIGLAGVTAIAVAYLLLQTGRMSAASPAFSLINAGGAALVLVSLAVDFNLSAALIEGFWLVVSLYGLVRSLRRRSEPMHPPPGASRPPPTARPDP